MVMLKRAPNSMIGTKAHISVLGATRMVYQTPLFFIETFVISNIQLIVMFHLTTT